MEMASAALDVPDMPERCTIRTMNTCSLLDQQLALNKVLKHINASLAETEPDVLTLSVERPLSPPPESGTAEKLLLTLVEVHECIMGFKFNEADDTLVSQILSLLRERTNIKCLRYSPSMNSSLETLGHFVAVLGVSDSVNDFHLRVCSVSERTARELGYHLRRNTLRRLSLTGEANTTLGYFAGPVVHKASEPSATPNLTDVSLEIRKDRFQECTFFSRLLPTDTSMTCLKIWNSESASVSDDILMALAAALKTNTTLKKLSVFVRLGDVGAAALGDVLKYNDGLTNLDVTDGCTEGVDVCRYLAEGAEFTKTLNKLSLDVGSIKRPGFLRLSEGLSKNVSGLVIAFRLAGCESYTTRNMATTIDEHGLSGRITFTWNSRDGLWSTDFAKYKHLMSDVIWNSADSDVPLNEMFDYMKDADILEKFECFNPQMRKCPLFAAYLRSTHALRCLAVTFHDEPPEALAELLSALESNRSIEELHLSEDPRYGPLTVWQPLSKMLRNNKALERVTVGFAVDESSLGLIIDSLSVNYTVREFRMDDRKGTPPKGTSYSAAEITSRNAMLMELALHFVRKDALRRRWAEAFDLLSDSEAFRRKIAAERNIAPDLADWLILRKTRFLRRNFFALTAVVKERIVCMEQMTRAPQLHNLSADCIAKIASFLRVGDIKSRSVCE